MTHLTLVADKVKLSPKNLAGPDGERSGPIIIYE